MVSCQTACLGIKGSADCIMFPFAYELKHMLKRGAHCCDGLFIEERDHMQQQEGGLSSVQHNMIKPQEV
eukprot:38647-Pelagomonas_calceolata.AAC.1